MLPVFRLLVWALCCPFRCCWCLLLDYGEDKCCPFSAVGCRRHAAYFIDVGATFYTSPSVNAARFAAFGVGVALSIFLHLVRLSHYGEGKCCPFCSRWCRRYAADLVAVGAAFYTTARVNAVRISAVGVADILSILLLLVPPFTIGRG